MGSCCVFLAYLVQPQTSFPGMPRKAGSDEGGLAHFLSKSMLGPLRHTSEYREQTDGAPLQQDCVWTAAYCRPQNACCAFNTFGVICGPAAARGFFFFFLYHGLLQSGIFISVIGQNRALGRQTEDTRKDVTYASLLEGVEAGSTQHKARTHLYTRTHLDTHKRTCVLAPSSLPWLPKQLGYPPERNLSK